MLYLLFILAVVVTVLYLTNPGFILRRKFRGQDFYKVISDEEHSHKFVLLSRGIQVILHSLIYYPVIFIAVPLVILWAISNEIGLQIFSYIAGIAIVVLVLQFLKLGSSVWQAISGREKGVKIRTDEGQIYEGKLISEEKIVKVDVSMRDGEGTAESSHLYGILLEEDERRIKFVTSEGIKIVRKSIYDLIIKKETVIKAEIQLKDGTRKIGRRTYILGENPFKDFCRNLPDLLLALYLWYLVVLIG